MEKLKIKTIGVLRERRDDEPDKKTVGGVAAGGRHQQLQKQQQQQQAQQHQQALAQAQARQQMAVAAKAIGPDPISLLNCRRRLEWTKEWLRTTEFLNKENLMEDLQLRSNETYHLNCYLDITERQFHYLVTKMAPVISQFEPHRKKKAFSAEERIAITLKYLATGEFHSCRNYCLRASKPVILKMISDICLKMFELLKDQFVTLPKTEDQWLHVAREMEHRTGLPNCIGGISMRQIAAQPLGAYHESKATSLILTAIMNSTNNFMYVNVERGRETGCANAFEHSNVKQLLENNNLNVPVTSSQQQQHQQQPSSRDDAMDTYYFVGSEELPLKTYLLNSMQAPAAAASPAPTVALQLGTDGRPIETPNNFGKAVNQINTQTENVFTMLSNIFNVLATPLRMDETHARNIIVGCVTLYNFLRKTDRTFFKRTERLNSFSCNGTQANGVSLNGFSSSEFPLEEDDDCIFISESDGSEEAKHEEPLPKLVTTSCFRPLGKQNGDTELGMKKCGHLMHFMMTDQRPVQPNPPQ